MGYNLDSCFGLCAEQAYITSQQTRNFLVTLAEGYS